QLRSRTETAPPTIYTLSLHDALPILIHKNMPVDRQAAEVDRVKRSESGMILHPITLGPDRPLREAVHLMERFRIRWTASRSGRSDRKSTRLNSSHRTISYAVFCLKKK